LVTASEDRLPDPDRVATEAGCPQRPRSIRDRQAVLDVTNELLAEGRLPAVTIDGISTRSGVSKAVPAPAGSTRTHSAPATAV
jgi:hypothetical protein